MSALARLRLIVHDLESDMIEKVCELCSLGLMEGAVAHVCPAVFA